MFSLVALHFIYSRQGLLLNQAKQPKFASGIPCLSSECRDYRLCQVLCVGTRDLNSGPHTQMASTFPNEPSLRFLA